MSSAVLKLPDADSPHTAESSRRAARREAVEPVPAAPPPPFVLESLGPTEQRASFRVADSWSRVTTIGLQAGVRLSVAACQFEPSFSFAIQQPATELELVVSRGGAMVSRTRDGREIERGGNTLQLGRLRRPLDLHVRPAGEAKMECVSVALSVARLRELMGVEELPEAFRSVIASREPFPLVTQEVTPGLYRLLEEILNADVRGPARLLWHEAKSLELIAVMTDELAEASRANDPHLTAHDIERLERARQALVEHLDDPPTLVELARAAGFNETKLKGGFRTLFGTSVFAYLREARMEEARRLLGLRHLNVTEVAQQVGYANPSKFAAAFRRQFGVSPSGL